MHELLLMVKSAAAKFDERLGIAANDAVTPVTAAEA
jgi:hypothetical protein